MSHRANTLIVAMKKGIITQQQLGCAVAPDMRRGGYMTTDYGRELFEKLDDLTIAHAVRKRMNIK